MIQARRVKIAFICALLAIALVLALLAPIQSGSAQSGPSVVMLGDTTVANGSTFTVDIVVQPDPSLPVGVVQAYLEFDESYLQVVGSSHPSGPLIPGPVFDSTWEDIILNTADNNTGEISFAGGKGPSGSDAQTAFVLARVQFQALSETPPGSGTDLIFNVNVPQRTRAVSGITDVTSTLFGTTIHVVNNVDAPMTLELQGRPPIPDDSWMMGFIIDLYAPGAMPPADSPLHSYTASTNPSGTLQVAVPSGLYDIRVKGANTLRVMQPNVDLTSDTPPPIDLGAQIAGDSNDDNIVDINDYSDVRAAFGVVVASLPPNLQGADHNGDTIIDTIDYSIVVSNFGESGAPP